MNQDYNLNFYFYNLDGNKSNFDTLAGELHRFGDKFSFIGLAETNVDSQHKDLYKLSNILCIDNILCNQIEVIQHSGAWTDFPGGLGGSNPPGSGKHPPRKC